MMSYRIAQATIILFLLTLLFPALSTGQQRRRNIGRFFDKLRAGRSVTVAYLGGSTAAGMGANQAKKSSYGALVTAWLRARYPQAQIHELNAAISGTGSLYGAIRLRRDVIAHKPDLVFIDLALDDASEKETAVTISFEGIIRQLLTTTQPPEIVLIYATSPTCDARVELYEPIAEHYAIPAINLQNPSWGCRDEGASIQVELWKDQGHLLDANHQVYAELITAFLAEQEQLKPSPLLIPPPPPLRSDELTYGELKPFAGLCRASGWRLEASSDHALPSTLLVNHKAGAQIEVPFEGTAVGIAYRAGPDVGMIECLIDGRPAPAPLTRIDGYDSVSRIQTRILVGGLTPGEHRLTIRLLGEKNPKSSGHYFRLGYLLLGGQRPERL